MDANSATASERLLFLPGAAGRREVWARVAERLDHPAPRKLVGWPGFGGLPEDPSVHGLDDLARLLEPELDRPVDLFAQSMGGVVALLLALRHPERVRHLVLSVTSGGIDVAGLGGEDWRPRFRANHPHVPDWFVRERRNLEPELARVRAPTLLLFGDSDPISPVAVGERLRDLLPAAELVVVPGGGHDLVEDAADFVLPHIERHLAR